MLIMTAAHCVTGTIARAPYADKDFVFSPGWANGKSPYGEWVVTRVIVTSTWLECPVPVIDCHTDPIYDYAFMVVKPLHGRHIADVTGTDGTEISRPSGPWFSSVDRYGVGILIGDTGGLDQGGPASGNPTYSDVWNGDFGALLEASQKSE